MNDKRLLPPEQRGTPDRRLFLARNKGTGEIQIEDGPHSTPEGVAKARKLHETIFGSKGPWLLVEIHPFPEADPEINEEAAGTCRRLVEAWS